MASPSRYAIAFVATTVALAGGLYWLGAHPLLAGVAGASWGVGVTATTSLANRFPGFETGSTWEDVRWTQVSVVVTVVAFGGIVRLPLSLEYRVAVLVLVGGVGLTSYVTGTLSVLDQVDVGEALSSSEPADPSVSSGE